MEVYRNLDGDSGVVAYEFGQGWIVVQFVAGGVYEYTDASAGAANVATMKGLAAAGEGLNAFINRHVRRGYSRRLR